MIIASVTIFGRGRVGHSLARALERCGVAVDLRPATALADGTGSPGEDRTATAVVLAVPDDALATLSQSLARRASLPPDAVVLHTSGLHDRTVLAPLHGVVAGCGSWHPLMTLADPAGSPDALMRSPVVLEGDRGALEMGRRLAATLGIERVVEVAPGGKAAYHAGAVFASNYLIVLAAIAERLGHQAGMASVAGLYGPLMEETLQNLARLGASNALTGPVARGDEGTIAAHLGVLDAETGELYRRLASEAADLARAREGGAPLSAAAPPPAPPKAP